MPAAAVKLKFRRIKQRFGIAAPRVVVRSHLSWRWYGAILLAIFLLLLSVTWAIVRQGESGELLKEVTSLREQLGAAQEELLLFRSTAGTEESAAQMERSARQELLARISMLERENAFLKEEMLLVERLGSGSGGEAGLRLEAFQVVAEGEGRHRFRLLMAFRPGSTAQVFRGRLQLRVVAKVSGQPLEILLPAKSASGDEYDLEIRHFARKEGVFELPAGAVLEAVEARVLQGGTLVQQRLVRP